MRLRLLKLIVILYTNYRKSKIHKLTAVILFISNVTVKFHLNPFVVSD